MIGSIFRLFRSLTTSTQKGIENPMTKHFMYASLTDKDTQKQEIETTKAIEIVENIVRASFTGDCSVHEATGTVIKDAKAFNEGRKADIGTSTPETMVHVELNDAPPHAIKSIVDGIKKALNQESILLQWTDHM